VTILPRPGRCFARPTTNGNLGAELGADDQIPANPVDRSLINPEGLLREELARD